MSDVAIRVESLSKRYRLGERQRSRSLRESLTAALSAPFRRHTRQAQETIWALKDVSFEVKRGEVVGVIGRNGAGKSTLLKILSRITEPTSGRAEVHGRVGSLLEVGTGFHNELTGRENLYLNGAILGMKRAEIARKFDEIVTFAEVEKFIDTPVKHYSSGMYLRLAFAVAAHMEPEILLVDEVLAVGDAAFQKKCLGKMGEVSKQGRTVLFVSHNLAAVLSLCPRTILLSGGRVVAMGSTPEIEERYASEASILATVPLAERVDRDGDGRMRLTVVRVTSDAGEAIHCGDRLQVHIAYEAALPVANATFLLGIYDQFNRPIFFLDSSAAGGLPETLPAVGAVDCTTGPINLTVGPCIVNVAALVHGTMADHIVYVNRFDVEPDDFFGTGKLTERSTALILLPQCWKLRVD